MLQKIIGFFRGKDAQFRYLSRAELIDVINTQRNVINMLLDELDANEVKQQPKKKGRKKKEENKD